MQGSCQTSEAGAAYKLSYINMIGGHFSEVSTQSRRWVGGSEARLVDFGQAAHTFASFPQGTSLLSWTWGHPYSIIPVPHPALIRRRSMIQEASASRYKAVLCQRCREPIPVPTIVFSMAESAEQEKV